MGAGKCQSIAGYPACFPNNVVPCTAAGMACTYDNAAGVCTDVLGMKYCLPSSAATIAPCTNGSPCVDSKGQKGSCIGIAGVYACFVDQSTAVASPSPPPQPTATPVPGVGSGGNTGPKTWAPGASTTTLPPSPPCGTDGYGVGEMCVTGGVGGSCGMDKNGQWFCAATSLKVSREVVVFFFFPIGNLFVQSK